MHGLREFGNALVIALISISLMVGALSISLVEFVPKEASTPTNVIMPSPAPRTATVTPLPTQTPTLGLESPTVTNTSTLVNTNTPPASCPPPPGWVNQIIIQGGETLEILAARYRVNKDELRRANCLSSDNLVAGTILYVPPAPTSTVAVCNPGASGWSKAYTVKSGDTLYAIATNYYITAGLLRSVNCRAGDLIYTGEVLWVPTVSTRTPYPTPLPGSTVTPYPTDPLTETALPFTLTPIPTDTLIPATPTVIPTLTAAPTTTASLTAFPTVSAP